MGGQHILLRKILPNRSENGALLIFQCHYLRNYTYFRSMGCRRPASLDGIWEMEFDGSKSSALYNSYDRFNVHDLQPDLVPIL